VGREQHSRRTDSTLRGPVIDEGLLETRQPSTLGKTFYGNDLATFDLTHRDQTTVYDFTIDQDRTGAALAFPASLFRAGFAEIFAKHVEQSPGARSFE
jgi:hypothetical protein